MSIIELDTSNWTQEDWDRWDKEGRVPNKVTPATYHSSREPESGPGRSQERTESG